MADAVRTIYCTPTAQSCTRFDRKIKEVGQSVAPEKCVSINSLMEATAHVKASGMPA